MLCLVEVVALFIDHGIENSVLLRLLIDDQATVASRGAYAHDTSVPPRKGSRRVATAAGRRRPLPNKALKLSWQRQDHSEAEDRFVLLGMSHTLPNTMLQDARGCPQLNARAVGQRSRDRSMGM
jgi:hypothetical protein